MLTACAQRWEEKVESKKSKRRASAARDFGIINSSPNNPLNDSGKLSIEQASRLGHAMGSDCGPYSPEPERTPRELFIPLSSRESLQRGDENLCRPHGTHIISYLPSTPPSTPIRAKAARIGDPGPAACWAKLFRAYGAGFSAAVLHRQREPVPQASLCTARAGLQASVQAPYDCSSRLHSLLKNSDSARVAGSSRL